MHYTALFHNWGGYYNSFILQTLRFLPRASAAVTTTGVGYSVWYMLMKCSVSERFEQQQQPVKKCLLTYLDHIINVGSMYMYVEIRFYQESP